MELVIYISLIVIETLLLIGIIFALVKGYEKPKSNKKDIKKEKEYYYKNNIPM